MVAEVEIVEALRPVVTAEGLELWDVERTGACLTVLVDRQGGVDLDCLAQLSGTISDFLDLHEELAPAGRYELDVSSPGLERRLRAPEHYDRCVGQEVAIKTSAAIDGARRFLGTLLAAANGEVVLRCERDGAQPVEVRLPLDGIERAHTVFRWGPPPRPVSPSRGKPRAASSKGGPDRRPTIAQASKEG